MCPYPTLQVRGYAHRPHMARGQDGFASPFLYDSFIHYFTPVYPDAIQGGALYYLRPVSLRAAQIFSGDLAFGLIDQKRCKVASGRQGGCQDYPDQGQVALTDAALETVMHTNQEAFQER